MSEAAPRLPNETGPRRGEPTAGAAGAAGDAGHSGASASDGRSLPQTTEIRQVDDAASLAAARALIRDHVEAHSTNHDAAAADALVAALPAPYLPPVGGLWVAWDGPTPLGCVALQPLEPGVAEVKRMFVHPRARGRGVGRRLMLHVLAHAHASGVRRLRLGTLTTMHAARRLYATLGFRPVAAYRPVEFGDTLFYELALDAAPDA